jgi:alkanesulfonate monooxygenase SsuD/methylene tetrahydromethanopterin reductase-like flavin-dependent oxidoreductase (luciferase family)
VTDAYPRRLGAAAIMHALPFEELLALVRHAEGAGYEAFYIDGDVSFVPSLGNQDVLDGWTVQTALTLATERIQIVGIRLVHHWNAGRLAQATATLERIAPGRQRVLLAIGGQPADRRFGLPMPTTRERIAWLEELVPALRALWAGEAVATDGRHVRLEGARAQLLRSPDLRIELAGRGPRMLGAVARHGDAWNINLPAIPALVDEATAHLEAACRARDRDPASIERVAWLFARPLADAAAPAPLADFRRLNPWFAEIPDEPIAAGLLCGGMEQARAKLAAATRRMRLDLPVVEVTGLPIDAAQHALDALRPEPPEARASS